MRTPVSYGGTHLRSLAFASLAVFVFSMPWDDYVAIPGIGSLARLMGMLTIVLAGASLVQRGWLRLRLPSPFLVASFLYIVWGATSIVWSFEPSVTFSQFITYAQLLAMVWLVWELARDRRAGNILMQAYVLGGCVAMAIALTAYFTTHELRNVGEAFNANDFAFYIALGIPMAWRLATTRAFPALRWLNLLYLPAVFLSIVVAASRGGLLTALVAYAIIPLTPNMRLSRKVALLIAFTAAGILVYNSIPTLFPELQGGLQRLAETRSELQSGTLTDRRIIWQAGFDVFRDNSYIGVGLGGFRYAIAPIYGEVMASHNSFLTVLVDLGTLGLVLFLLVLGTAILPTLLSSAGSRTFGIILMLTLLVGMMPLEVNDRKPVWFVLSLISIQRAVLLTPSLWLLTDSSESRATAEE